MQDFSPRTRARSSSRVSALLYPLLGACFWASVSGYKPVIIVHGLFDSSEDFKNLKLFINQVSRATSMEPVVCGLRGVNRMFRRPPACISPV